ncbi:Protein AAGR-2 [Aphelenchoides avenae]|nr:Protein AAGR-2 [Aphelenchus avenae]
MVPKNIQNQYPMAKNTKIMLGVVWPDKHVAFPDFLERTNKTNQWWVQEFVRFHKTLPFDGIWVDMNEPSNFGTNSPNDPQYPGGHPPDVPLSCPLTGNDSFYDVPPFETINAYQWGKGTHLCTKTLCMLGSTVGGTNRFYNTKSLYGWSESVATYSALGASTGKRGAVISRSTYPSSGKYAGHWLGDNTARWEDLRTAIIGAQEFNMFGIPYVGSDVCGFAGVSNEELCLRWQQLGAFHSFYRNHNAIGNPPQDPAQWPSVANATRQANLWRYRHLPYLFSLHFKASMHGGTVVRPVFFEFPGDLVAPTLSHQFMWGPAIIVIPVLYSGVDSVNGYLPTKATWYSLSDDRYGLKITPGHAEFPAPKDKHIPVFVRGGHVIPRQAPSTTTTASRLNEFQLLVALEHHRDNESIATGELLWDDGEALVDDFVSHEYWHFLYNVVVTKEATNVVVTATKWPKNPAALKLPTLGEIEFFDYGFRPNLRKATLNGKPLKVDVQKSTYSPILKIVRVVTPGLVDFNTGDRVWNISWPNI